MKFYLKVHRRGALLGLRRRRWESNNISKCREMRCGDVKDGPVCFTVLSVSRNIHCGTTVTSRSLLNNRLKVLSYFCPTCIMAMVESYGEKQSLFNSNMILEYVEELNPGVFPSEHYFQPLPNTTLRVLPVDQTVWSAFSCAVSTQIGMFDNKNCVQTI